MPLLGGIVVLSFHGQLTFQKKSTYSIETKHGRFRIAAFYLTTDTSSADLPRGHRIELPLAHS